MTCIKMFCVEITNHQSLVSYHKQVTVICISDLAPEGSVHETRDTCILDLVYRNITCSCCECVLIITVQVCGDLEES